MSIIDKINGAISWYADAMDSEYQRDYFPNKKVEDLTVLDRASGFGRNILKYTIGLLPAACSDNSEFTKPSKDDVRIDKVMSLCNSEDLEACNSYSTCADEYKICKASPIITGTMTDGQKELFKDEYDHEWRAGDGQWCSDLCEDINKDKMNSYSSGEVDGDAEATEGEQEVDGDATEAEQSEEISEE